MKNDLLLKITTFCLLSFFINPSLFAFQPETASADTSDVIDKILLERITVVGVPVWMSTVPGAANYVSAEQLQKHGYTDINRILRSISGINIQEEDGFGLRPNIGLRGAGVERSSKINVMEDGILVAPAPYSAPAAYYFPNMGRINTVEVRKGSSQIKYGPNTTGGAINLISTPIPAEQKGRAEISVGERSANKLYANYGNRTGRFGYLVELLQMGDDGFKQLENGENTGYQLRDVMGKLMFRSSNDASIYQRLEVKIGYHTETSDETYVGLTRDDFVNSPLLRYAGSQVDQMNVDQSQFTARHFVLLSDRVDVTTTAYRQNVSRAWYKLNNLNGNLPSINTGSLGTILSNPDANTTELGYLKGNTSPDNAFIVRNNSRDYYSQGVQSILGYSFEAGGTSNQLEAGIRLHYDEEDRFQFEDGYRMQDGVMILTNQGVPGTQANRIGSATALSIFLQDRLTTDRWTFTPGVRFEYIWFNNKNFGGNDIERTGINLNETKYTTSIFIPGIGASYVATDNLTFIAGIHRGFSPPSPGSSSETTSELSVNYELGARFANDLLQTELIGFYNDYSNLLGSDLTAGGGSGTNAQFNAGSVTVFGLEASANVELSQLFGRTNFSLPLNINYTFTNATFQNDFNSSFGPWGTVSSGDEIPFIPRHQFNSGLSFNYKGSSTNLNAIYSPQMRTEAGSGPIPVNSSTDEYIVLDLNTGYSITPNVELFLNIRNLLDETYIVSDRPYGVRPGLPRTFMGGLKINI